MKNKILINILLIIGIIVFSNTLVKAEDKLDNVDMTLDKISIIGDTTTFSEKDKIYFDIKTTGDVKFISLAFNYENLDNESTGLLLHAQKENDKYYISLSDIQTSGTLKLYEGTYNLDFVYLCSDAGGGSTENNYIFYSKDTSSIEDHRKLNDDISFTVKNSITLDKISIIGDTTTFSEKDKIYLNIKANEEIKEMFLEIVDDTNDNVFNAQVLDVNNEPYIDLSKLECKYGNSNFKIYKQL